MTFDIAVSLALLVGAAVLMMRFGRGVSGFAENDALDPALVEDGTRAHPAVIRAPAGAPQPDTETPRRPAPRQA